MPSLVGIDVGLTVTKAVVFDTDGTVLSVARRRVPQLMPKDHFVERDMDVLWAAAAQAIREALDLSGRTANDVAAVAATAHGDGIYLLGKDERPLGPGILSLDSRASNIVETWRKNGVSKQALALTGQSPLPPSPTSVLAWIKQHEPERFQNIAHFFACKDWLRFCLTGTVGTDRTEASTFFTEVNSQTHSDDVLEIFGLEAIKHALPRISGSAETVGRVTGAAARITGLAEGTPVAAGLHDVTASALGIGAHKLGVMAAIAGTYSINEVVSLEPRTGDGWLCRNAIAPKMWNNMAISPASSANYEWFLESLCQEEAKQAAANGYSVHDVLAAEIQGALNKPSSLIFHPFLFGSPYGADASAAFLGLRGWHDRGTMLRSVLEGIIFNHRVHIDALRTAFTFDRVMLTGGISRNPLFAQIFADATGLVVQTSETSEAAAWGAALCAGAATGHYKSPQDDPRDLEAICTSFQPDPARSAKLEKRYQLFCEAAAAMAPLWPKLEQLAGQDYDQP
jgi:L-xylulokinase